MLVLAVGCKRHKPPAAKRVWLGPSGGCIEHAGGMACWGQLGGDKVATAFDTGGPVKELALGEKHACAILGTSPKCWGIDAPPVTGAVDVTIGGHDTCFRTGEGVRCVAGEWPPGKVRSVAIGARHTCVAYDRDRVSCGPGESILGGVVVKELAAGDDHTCALVDDGTVRCWGKNDRGQLGDGTINDAATPVSVAGLRDVIQVAAGRRHTCALLRIGTVACWGDNAHHQLANGGVEPASRAAIVVGLVGAKELTIAGDGACVRLEGGYVRCWGQNDRSQLGDGTTQEHNVPMPIRYR